MDQLLQNPGTTGNKHLDVLFFMFEGKQYEWNEQYITEKQIRKLTNSEDNAGELFMEISDPWKDEKVKDHEPVDLARPGIEQFYLRKPLPYAINEIRFESSSQYIRGKRIRHQGAIPADDDIFLVIEKPWEDELIEDDTWVNLARPGIEKFESRTVDRKVILFVNAVEKPWNKKKITFNEVVILEYGSVDPNPDIVYSITYKNGPKENPEGIMSQNETLFVKNKMKFYVTRTNKS